MRFLPLLSLLAAAPLAAQSPAPIPASLRPLLESLRTTNAWTLEQQRTLCEIPSPPFKEAARAAEFRARFAALGYADARLDGIGNVVAELPGKARRPLVVVSAHLDTVFPEGTDVTVRTTGTVMKAPGIGDDCRGLAVLLAAARAMKSLGGKLPGTIVFAGTVGEEGLGNSRGARHLLEQTLVRDTVDAFLSVDADAFEIVNTHVGSHRYRVTFSGPGGHSYEAFGMPNPIHAMGRAIAGIADLQVASEPKTTFSVGVVEGGRSVNAIADRASFLLDLRSSSADALDRADAEAHRIILAAVAAERARWPASTAALSVTIDTLGVRAAGMVPAESPLVRTAATTARALGGTPVFRAASTDAAAGTRLGIPAITVGAGGVGSGAHSLEEQYDDGERGWTGPQWVALLTTTLAGLR